MRVIPYYCALCGVRISPEDARFGRSAKDARTFYCPTCVIEHQVDTASSGVSLTSDERRARDRGGAGAAHDLATRDRPRVARAHSGRQARAAEASGAPRGPRAWPLALGGAGLLAVGFAAAMLAGRAPPPNGMSVDPDVVARAAAAGPLGAGGAAARPLAGVNPAAVVATTAAEKAADEALRRELTSSGADGAREASNDGAARDANADPASSAVGALSTGAGAPEREATATAREPEAGAARLTTLVLNERTGTLHREGCRWEKRIAGTNRVELRARDELAKHEAKSKPCRECLPRGLPEGWR